jgi:hypothetical protein
MPQPAEPHRLKSVLRFMWSSAPGRQDHVVDLIEFPFILPAPSAPKIPENSEMDEMDEMDRSDPIWAERSRVAEVSVQLTGWKAIAALALVIAIIGIRFSLRFPRVTDDGREALRVWLVDDYVRMEPRQARASCQRLSGGAASQFACATGCGSAG